MLRYFETMAPSTAASISASSNTTNGALPPSSSPSFFTPTAACWIQDLADLGRSGEADKAHRGMLAQHLADLRGFAGEDIEHALRHARLLGQRHQRQRGQRRLVGGLEHDGAAGGQRRRDLAGDHRAGKVPRRDRAADPDRLADRQQPCVRPLRRNGLAIDPSCLLGEELDIGAADVDFAERLRQRLALLGGEDQREIFAVGDDQVEPFAQDVGALLGGKFRPGRKRPLGGFDRLRCFRRAHHRHLRQLDAVDRIGHGIGRGAGPGAVDVALVAQQRRILQAVAERRRGGLRSACGSGRGHGVTPRSSCFGSCRG